MHYAKQMDTEEEAEEIAEAIAASTAKYPQIVVRLVGEDGNAMAIMGRVAKALKRGGVQQSEVDAFYEECKSGNYDHLLYTCTLWVTVL